MKGLVAQLERAEPQAARASLTGRFWARVWDLDCVLELHLNELGCITGWFEADGQRLEVSGGAPDESVDESVDGSVDESVDGSLEVSGVIRDRHLSEPFAVFRAKADAQGLLLEIRAAGDPSSLERVVFVRLT